MFKKRITTKDVYDTLIEYIDKVRSHSEIVETHKENYKEDLSKLMADLEHAKKMLGEKISELEFTADLLDAERKINEELRETNKELNREISRLTGIVENNRKFQDKIEIYLREVAKVAMNVQKSTLDKNVNATAYMRNNLAKETKVKLK